VPWVDPNMGDKYGFYWPSGPKNGPAINVTRAAEIKRRPSDRGVYRVITVETEKDQLDVTITPGGKIRVGGVRKRGDA